jgi:hypothetical protein
MDKKRIINSLRKKKNFGLANIPYDRAAWHSEDVKEKGLPLWLPTFTQVCYSVGP